MSEDEPKKGEPKEPPPGNGGAATSWDVAKWLIPSVGALSVLLGYIAKLSHHALLGFDPGLQEPNEYLATTGDFIGWLFELISSVGAVWTNALFDGPHFWVLGLSAAMSLPLTLHLIRQKLKKSTWGLFKKHQWLAKPTVAMLVILILRLVAFDAPVAKLEGALVESEVWSSSTPESPATSRHVELGGRLDIQANPISKRALTLWDAMRCARPTMATATANLSGPCTHDSSEAILKGEGFAQLLVDFLLLTLAVSTLVCQPTPPSSAMALLAIGSCLSLAATYGKLGHSLEYDFASIGLKTSKSFADDSPPASASKPEKAASSAADKAKAAAARRADQHTLEGVVLLSDKSWTTIVVQQPLGCIASVKLWRLSNSEILWERDIYRTDVLTWSAAKTLASGANCDLPKASLHGNQPTPTRAASAASQ